MSSASPLPPPSSNIPGYTRAAIRKRRSTFFAVVGITLMAGIWLLPASLGRNGYNIIVRISPVLIGIALAIPFSIITAGVTSGKKRGFFATREELRPLWVISQLEKNLSKVHVREDPFPPLAKNYGLLQSLLDPYVNALHVSLLHHRQRVTPENRAYLDGLRRRLVKDGPGALNKRELSAVMYDPDVMQRLHYDLWSGSGEGLSPWWDAAIRQYNILTREPVTALYR